jgi:uncharacterized protein (TIGR02145 family)
MKKITSFLMLCFLLQTVVLKAQTPPNAFNYSAVARDAVGQPIATKTIGIQVDILKNSPTGTSQYSENHFVNTDAFGLFNLVIGAGAIQSGSMVTIDWSNDNYYLKVGMDATGGTNFLTMGTTQLLSVPYALYAKSAGSVSGGSVSDNQKLSVSLIGDTLYLQNGGFVIIPGISAANTPAQLATLTTSVVSSITDTSAVSGGNITNNGGASITAKGIVWSTNQNPTLISKLGSTNDGVGTGSFGTYLFNLNANTTYFVRAYATNSVGTAYGNELSFTTTSSGNGIVTNPGSGVTFDGYTYASIVLGNGQEWMAENLRTTTYANGDSIPNVTINSKWESLTTGAWSHNNNDSQYENPYGKLYNWYTISDSRNVCPTGWHVPTNLEWTALIDYLGDQSVAGGKMKSKGSQYWLTLNTATNESGFSGLPGGSLIVPAVATMLNMGYAGCWWSSTESNAFSAWYYSLFSDQVNVEKSDYSKRCGFSVRCLMD